jgi:hypothetical protein
MLLCNCLCDCYSVALFCKRMRQWLFGLWLLLLLLLLLLRLVLLLLLCAIQRPAL